MTDKRFYTIWNDALTQPSEELFIAEYGYPEWFDEISSDLDETIDTLKRIHRVANMTVRDIISETGLSQAAFARKFCIPRRTIENWACGVNQCPDYVRLLIARQLGII